MFPSFRTGFPFTCQCFFLPGLIAAITSCRQLIFSINFFALTTKTGSQPKKLWCVSVSYSFIIWSAINQSCLANSAHQLVDLEPTHWMVCPRVLSLKKYNRFLLIPCRRMLTFNRWGHQKTAEGERSQENQGNRPQLLCLCWTARRCRIGSFYRLTWCRSLFLVDWMVVMLFMHLGYADP